MVRARHFEYCFRSQNIEPLVEDFQRFYQMTVMLAFFSFSQRKGAPKIMTAPKGLTKWKAKFFYAKEAVVTCKLDFRNATGTIASEHLNVPEEGNQGWLQHLQLVPLKTLGNKELQYLRMMLWNKPRHKMKLVLKENNKGYFVVMVAFWRFFRADFEGKLEVVDCDAGEEGWYQTTVGNFQLPNQAALNAPLPRGKGKVFMPAHNIVLVVCLV
ncbi:hypothetical protein HanOQP8_Chr10g0362221 [Helianthus annuus]|nr:hypothetical protein HanOQP8_Chr10g0362221 [Helianthus annuus]KAJ0883424.1 hypothetical protein HanPSC8_Chr10g0421371 [Helianthus annuus]